MSPLDHYIAQAVMLGSTEGRPMTALKLAAFLELPRATITRRLDTLIERHLVMRQPNGSYVIVPETFEPLAPNVEHAIKLILRTAKELEKLGYCP